MYIVKLANDHTEAASKITHFTQDGFTSKDIYVFAYDKKESEQITNATETNKVGFKEQGLKSISSFFKSRGSELHSKLQALGMDEPEAAKWESQLERGLLLIVAVRKETNNRE